jgi:hypothetical protein
MLDLLTTSSNLVVLAAFPQTAFPRTDVPLSHQLLTFSAIVAGLCLAVLTASAVLNELFDT